jgi:hypothetical protein
MGTRVDYALAREVASREGIKAVVDGEIVTLGGSYVLSARLIAAQTGDELASFRETAESAADIIPAISRLSKKLREKTGESLRTIQNARSLDRVTTPSLQALQKYVAGTRAIEQEAIGPRARAARGSGIARHGICHGVPEARGRTEQPFLSARAGHGDHPEGVR